MPLLDRQQAFGYTQEDLRIILAPMAESGEEAVGSMGNDAALPVLSHRPKTLYSYFKQLFAQVTNPPIDPIREELVMSLVTFIGPRPNLLGIDVTDPAMRLEATQPILTNDAMEKIRHIALFTDGAFKSFELDICYPAAWGADGMEAALASLSAQAEDAIHLGYNILIVSDRKVSADLLPIPALLATAAVHQHLVRKGLRTSTGLVVETGSAREVHHFALLAGYGAEAIHPYLALETLVTLAGMGADPAPHESAKRFLKAINKGLYKVMSKMGISTYQSYCGAQIFEAVGLQREFVDKYFTGTPSNIEGVGLFEIAEEAARLHRLAFGDNPLLADALDAGGEYQYRIRGEEHAWTPDSIAKLQHAARSGSFATYREYAALINDQSERMLTLRGLFELKFAHVPIPLEDVEPAEEIVKRFATGAMSLGSISTEAHTTLAVAMNRIGGKSNTGEGGEDARRYPPIRKGETLRSRIDSAVVDIALKEGDSLRSKIKQVASARFGVTAEYLVNADQLQIKMAQGAKPGEGGQLPGHKVSEYIAQLRFAVPGVGLISPAPHHDIYSIEDLAQLIHDLKNGNPEASISVKLVSEVGVGTVAAGVAKAKADHVTIAGHDGGTGASPESSIKHAGTPWELGLAETQQTLVLNRLRGRIAVQVDGQMKTGPRRRRRRAPRRRRVRVRHRAARGDRLHHDAQVPPQHVPGRHRDAESGAAKEVHRPAGARRQLLLLRRRGSARADGEARDTALRRSHRSLRPSRQAPRHRALEGEGTRFLADLSSAEDARRGRAPPLRGAGSRARARARPSPHRRRCAGDRAQRARASRLSDPQRQPLGRRDALRHGAAVAAARNPDWLRRSRASGTQFGKGGLKPNAVRYGRGSPSALVTFSEAPIVKMFLATACGPRKFWSKRPSLFRSASLLWAANITSASGLR